MFLLWEFALDTASDQGSARAHANAQYKRGRSAVGGMRGETDKVFVQGDKGRETQKIDGMR